MTIEQTLGLMRHQLDALTKIDFGYPLGENVIRAPNRPDGLPSEFMSSAASSWLAGLYTACDGLSLPDVHVGYFVKPLERVMHFDRASEPESVILDREITVVPFGSTGGGSLFVVQSDCGSVLLLPPGRLVDGRYGGEAVGIRQVSETVCEFLELLLDDLTAFVADKSGHSYIASA